MVRKQTKPRTPRTTTPKPLFKTSGGKICEEPGCTKQCNYNLKGQKKARFCKKHKTPDMVNVKTPKCEDPSCDKQPSYNIPGETKKRFCKKHKQPGMINVKTLRCEDPNCDKHPVFNTPGKTRGRFCKTHKQPGMFNVKSLKCEDPNCDKRPVFNIPGETAGRFCFKHKEEGMINVKSNRCEDPECDKIPGYNIDGEKKGRFCFRHKEDGMIDVVSKRCISPLCDTIILNNKYNGYCRRCCVFLCPDIQVCRNYKTKEKDVVERIKEKYPNLSWVYDKRIQNGCSSRRPDLLLDKGDYLLIIEIDENQHQRYDCSCENKRLMQISQDVGHRPMIFIRFNPDDYIDEHRQKITSCWNVNQLGLFVVKRNKQKEWKERITLLLNQIEYWLNNIPSKTIEVIELFYNRN